MCFGNDHNNGDIVVLYGIVIYEFILRYLQGISNDCGEKLLELNLTA